MKKTLKWSLMMMLAVVGLTFASCSDDDDTPTVGTVEDVNGEFTGKMTYAKEAKEALKQEAEQKQLREKHGIQDNNTLIVEKNNLFKFCIRCFTKIVKIFVTAGIFLLASVGLMSLIYPDVREELMKVLIAIQKEITTMIQF